MNKARRRSKTKRLRNRHALIRGFDRAYSRFIDSFNGDLAAARQSYLRLRANWGSFDAQMKFYWPQRRIEPFFLKKSSMFNTLQKVLKVGLHGH
jgi:hypothetical protein